MNDFEKKFMNRNYFKIMTIGAIIFAASAYCVEAQIAAGGNYTLDQSVIASGGGVSSDTGNIFSITGTFGQPIAGTTSSNAPFSISSGFFSPPFLAPTAASVSVSGRVLTTDGSGLKNARVILTDLHGNSQTTVTASFGYYSFSEIEAGQTYILTVQSKRYQFAPQVINALEDIENLNFAAQSQSLLEQKAPPKSDTEK